MLVKEWKGRYGVDLGRVSWIVTVRHAVGWKRLGDRVVRRFHERTAVYPLKTITPKGCVCRPSLGRRLG